MACHALYRLKARNGQYSGSLKWAYAVYFCMFVVVFAANVTSLVVTIDRRAYANFDYFHIGLFSLLAFASYIPRLVNIRKPRL